MVYDTSRPLRLARAIGISLASHGAVLTLIVLQIAKGTPGRPTTIVPIREVPSSLIAWLDKPGAPGGGGGGGDHGTEKPRRTARPGRDRVTVPVARPRVLDQPRETEAVLPSQQLVIDAVPLASARESQPGALEASADQTTSQGPGDGGGAGAGDGPGIGDSRGAGLGDGLDREAGGGRPYRIGNGVTAPTAISIERPRYTADAMRARIQGSVLVECVVEPDGRCRNAHVVRSLDPSFGLDQEAVKATERWRFRPGTLLGRSVPVMVRIELAFAIR